MPGFDLGAYLLAELPAAVRRVEAWPAERLSNQACAADAAAEAIFRHHLDTSSSNPPSTTERSLQRDLSRPVASAW